MPRTLSRQLLQPRAYQTQVEAPLDLPRARGVHRLPPRSWASASVQAQGQGQGRRPRMAAAKAQAGMGWGGQGEVPVVRVLGPRHPPSPHLLLVLLLLQRQGGKPTACLGW